MIAWFVLSPSKGQTHMLWLAPGTRKLFTKLWANWLQQDSTPFYTCPSVHLVNRLRRSLPPLLQVNPLSCMYSLHTLIETLGLNWASLIIWRNLDMEVKVFSSCVRSTIPREASTGNLNVWPFIALIVCICKGGLYSATSWQISGYQVLSGQDKAGGSFRTTAGPRPILLLVHHDAKCMSTCSTLKVVEVIGWRNCTSPYRSCSVKIFS